MTEKVPENPGPFSLVEPIKDAIRTFCRSLSAGAVQSSGGAERIYYAGISLDALAVAVALALKDKVGADRIEELEAALREVIRANPVSGHLEVPQSRIARAALAAKEGK